MVAPWERSASCELQPGWLHAGGAAIHVPRRRRPGQLYVRSTIRAGIDQSATPPVGCIYVSICWALSQYNTFHFPPCTPGLRSFPRVGRLRCLRCTLFEVGGSPWRRIVAQFSRWVGLPVRRVLYTFWRWVGGRPPAIGSSIKTIFERYTVLNLLFSRLRVLNLVDLVICYTLSVYIPWYAHHMDAKSPLWLNWLVHQIFAAKVPGSIPTAGD
jgi:hypothetical protein